MQLKPRTKKNTLRDKNLNKVFNQLNKKIKKNIAIILSL